MFKDIVVIPKYFIYESHLVFSCLSICLQHFDNAEFMHPHCGLLLRILKFLFNPIKKIPPHSTFREINKHKEIHKCILY